MKKITLLIFIITTFNLFSQNNISTLSEGDLFYNKGLRFFNTHKKDSAIYFFSKAVSFYRTKNDSLNFVAALRKIAQINYDFGFLIKAENQAIEVLDLYEKLNKIKHQTYIFNLLGNISKKKKNFADAVKYHEKALNSRKNVLKHYNLSLASLNNLALVYQESSNYNKAVKLLDEALKFDSLKIKKPIVYARLIDNKAYNLFLADSTSNILSFFNEALKIRETEKSINGLTISHLHLAEYYIKKNNFKKALFHLKKSYDFTKQINDNYTLLTILKKLSVVNPQKSNSYFEEYQQINTIIINEEQSVKDISAKIKYQTEKKEKENLQLITEKVEQALLLEKEIKQKWLLSVGFVISLIILVIGGYFYQKNKKQKRIIETLQKELHHRVKNNLAIIDTFIEVAKEEFNNKAFDIKLTELQNRIESINEVHQQLYANKNVMQLDLKKYVETLSHNIQQSFMNDSIEIKQNISEKLRLNADKSFPVGLIINEFLTNSYKYAFDTNKGTISINLKEDDTSYSLSIKDDGKGLPDKFDIEQTESFGLRVIKLLAEQLKGTFLLDGSKGVTLNINFPKI